MREGRVISLIEQHRTEISALCRQFEVRRLEVFGSAATGVYRDESSDIDFLVEFARPTIPGYADRYFGLKEALEGVFGRPDAH